jgi:hypothetical protein
VAARRRRAHHPALVRFPGLLPRALGTRLEGLRTGAGPAGEAERAPRRRGRPCLRVVGGSPCGDRGEAPADIDLLIMGRPDRRTFARLSREAGDELGFEVSPTMLPRQERETDATGFKRSTARGRLLIGRPTAAESPRWSKDPVAMLTRSLFGPKPASRPRQSGRAGESRLHARRHLSAGSRDAPVCAGRGKARLATGTSPRPSMTSKSDDDLATLYRYSDLVWGGPGADNVYGGNGADIWVAGGFGEDTVNGGAGNDRVFANADNDRRLRRRRRRCALRRARRRHDHLRPGHRSRLRHVCGQGGGRLRAHDSPNR